MAYLIGQIVGGTVGVFLVFLLLEWAIFKRIFDDPLKGKLSSALAAYFVGSSLAGFGRADGGSYYWGSFIDYAVPAIIVGIYAFWQGKSLRERLLNEGAQTVFD